MLARRTISKSVELDEEADQNIDVEQTTSEVEKDMGQTWSEVQKDMELKKSEVPKFMRKITRVGRQRFSIKAEKHSDGKPIYRYGEHNRQWEYMPGLKPAVSWIASPYSECLQAKDGTASKERKVQCLDVFAMEHTDKRSCHPDRRPCHSRPCTCPGLEVCVSLDKDSVESECSAEDHPINSVMDFEEMGCLKSTAVANTSELFDYTCMTAPDDKTCRDGLPWFSRVLPVMTPVDCFRFCTGKGLDLFGILDGNECRCGASNANMATFHEEAPRKALLFDRMKLIPCLATHNIKVFRYTGPIQDTGIPVGFLAHTEEDMQYIFSVGNGTMIEYEGQMEDGGPREISNAPPSLVQELPHCPDCNYKPIWPTRSETPPQMPWPYLEFKDYVIVPYRWATQGEKFGIDEIKQDMDDVRKDAYRNAVKEIMKKTCVAFVEKTKAELEASGEGYIAVGVAVYPGCWAYAGYSGARPYLLSLGWCNSGAFQGSMIHENLHSLGIAHMQKRPDATQNVEGHGPFLQMHWDQIPDGWRPQYTPQQGMYMGSQYDGAGDPFVGWAPYDYGSIMHYSPSWPKSFDTIPEGHPTGQRTELSTGDVSMVNDLYQCKTKGASAMPTPMPTPMPTRVTPETYNWLLTEGPCGQSEDLSCITSPNYPSAYSSSQKCEIDVKNLQAESISVEDWNTESNWDTLMVNDQSYSGVSKPDQVVPVQDKQIIWTSDSSGEKKGWKMCLTAPPPTAPPNKPPLAPVPTPPPPMPLPPTPPPLASWTIISGDCEVSPGNSECLESLNYPEYYDNSAKCIVRATEHSGPIRIEDWNTESTYDTLTVNNKKYAMKNSASSSTVRFAELDGIVPTGDLVWSADSSQTKKGWKICVEKQGPIPPPTPVPPTPAPTSAPTPAPTPEPTLAPTPEPTPEPPTLASPPANWRVTEGNCKVEQEDPRCISSTDYPRSYPRKDHCLIQVQGSGIVQVSEFDTEGRASSFCWDWLEVENSKYCQSGRSRGGKELDGVKVSPGMIEWSSDFSTQKKGWKICLT